MSFWRLLWISAVAVALQGSAMAQVPSAAVPSIPSFQTIPLPQVPYDPLELVTGEPQPVQNAEDRAATITMLTNAHDLSTLRMHAYDLKTTFTSFGSSSSDGSWILEDMSPARDIYRWTAQGPSYSAIYLTAKQLLSSNQPVEALPLRLTQAREAIFYIYPEIGPRASLRVATGNLNGLEVRCILVAHHEGAAYPSARGRDWRESEYCVDPKSGLLETYSPVPGLYIRYDYASAIHFHNRIIPDAFTISEAGRPIIEAKTESATDPPGPENPLFSPSGLQALGAGANMTPALRIRSLIGVGTADPNSTVQVVVLHGIVSPERHFIEGEVLTSTDSSRNEAAMAHANKWPSCTCQLEDEQAGATAKSREAIFIVEFFGDAKQ